MTRATQRELRTLLLATGCLVTHRLSWLKAHVPGDVPEDHEDNTFGLPNGDALRKSLRRFFADQLKKVVGEVAKLGEDLDGPTPSVADWTPAMAARMVPLLGVYWDKAGKALMPRLGLDPADWRVTDPKIHEAIAEQAFDFCASTNATTDLEIAQAHEQLRRELAAGLGGRSPNSPELTPGETIPELTARVRKVFTRASKSRATAIARTEAARAVHSAALKSAEASGVVAAKKWLTSANSCPLCHKLADDVGAIALDATFATVGKSATYSAIRTPPAHPHCRCTLLFDLTDPDSTPVPAWEHPPAGTIKPAQPRKKKAPPEPEPEPEPTATPAAGDWPADPDDLKVVRMLGGSTGAELVEDAAGNRFVRKRGANADHLRSEVQADEIYRSFGAAVPEPRLYETPKGPVKLARFVEGRTLADLERDDPKAARAAEARLREHFALDALLGNWDVIGLSKDNVLVDAAGTPWRIDNGGSLDFRAQGSRKTPAQWNANPLDLWSMRDPKLNPSAAGVFHQVTSDQWAAQVLGLARADVALPESVDAILRERLAQMTDLADVHQTLRDDRFKADYTDDFCRHTSGIRATGISDAMPTRLTRERTKRGDEQQVKVWDDDGNEYDHLRGRDSLTKHFYNYVDSIGGKSSLISSWGDDQGGSSWSNKPQAFKWFITGQRAQDREKYYWLEGQDTAESYYNMQMAFDGAEAYRKSMIAQHAFTRELLSRVEFENKDADGRIKLMRTEDRAVMQAYGLKPGQKDCKMERGAVESYSIYRRVYVKGEELTIQEVPLHRVFGCYWQSKYGEQGGGLFLGDNENEFVAMAEDLSFDYSKIKRGDK